MQNTQQSSRDELFARQLAADLPVGDVVIAALPDGHKEQVWGVTALEWLARVAAGVELSTESTLIEVPVETIAEARTLSYQYRVACDDPTGTC
jgi:hypothetical protein